MWLQSSLRRAAYLATALLFGVLPWTTTGAVSTSGDINITVTPSVSGAGPLLTTATYTNYSGTSLPAGTPVSFGQAFRYGDVMPGTHPVIQDASTHTPLAGQQWDEVSTWIENGGNGSWRFGVWAAWLPAALAPGASFRFEFVSAAGAYSETSHQALTALCSGPAAHDLKIHLTDVRNQNDTVRDSGDAIFRLCDNIANTGRDAPRHVRAGNVYDEYVVSGVPVYSSGQKDPMLYVQANVDIFTKASDGVSPGDVRWVPEISNSWENVAAGSTGNPGNPGPAGFTNDPQSISYRPEIDDGAVSVLDWSGLDAAVNSASNPVQTVASGNCSSLSPPSCLLVPSSNGLNAWYMGQATRLTCSGTCVAGLTSGQLYYAWPSSQVAHQDLAQSTYVSLFLSPTGTEPGSTLMTTAQGSGTSSFSYRVQHYHFSTIQLLDANGQDNWSPFGTTTRVTRKVYPAFTAAEKLYWQQTGLIAPINLSQPSPELTPAPRHAQSANYMPNGTLNVIGGTGVGDRPDLGLTSEWAAQAWINGSEHNWDYARLFTLGSSTHGWATLLNEATGRIPTLNNGPPTGPGGNGVGGSYAALGAPQPQVTLNSGGSAILSGLADVPYDQPSTAIPAEWGQWGPGTYISHMPSFNGFTYPIFGSRHFLDMMRWHANQDYAQQRKGPGPALGQGYYRDNNAVFTDGNTYHYYGLTLDCCQIRGSAWLNRDITYAATYGSDSDQERAYFHDFLVETGHYYPLWIAYKDGPGSTAYSTSAAIPNSNDVANEPFISAYVGDAAYNMVTFLHEPLGSVWMSKFQRYFEGVLGGQLPGAPVSYYVNTYFFNPELKDGSASGFSDSRSNGNIGQFTNGVDASDYGTFIPNSMNVLTGGQLQQGQAGIWPITVGDTLKNFTTWWGSAPIDQLSGTRWYTMIGPIDNTQGTFYLQCTAADHATFPSQCPVAGGAFTGFTKGGVSLVNEFGVEGPKWRPQFDPGACNGYLSTNYIKYSGNTINALNVLGYNVTHALADFAFRCGSDYYNSSLPSFDWDPTVVIPGLPTPRDGL